MSDDTARAVGAGAGMPPVMINGKECEIRPLSLLEFTEIERACLNQFRLHRLEYLKESAHLLGDEEEAKQLVREEQLNMADWDVTDLPPKYVYSADALEVNPDIKKWLREEWDVNTKAKEMTVAKLQRMVAAALDNGLLTPEQYKAMVGELPKKVNVGYASWWITGSVDGMIEMIWKCFKPQGVEKEEVIRAVSRDKALMVDLSRTIEAVSVPDVGNG